MFFHPSLTYHRRASVEKPDFRKKKKRNGDVEGRILELICESRSIILSLAKNLDNHARFKRLATKGVGIFEELGHLIDSLPVSSPE